jgi:hypothetical protein
MDKVPDLIKFVSCGKRDNKQIYNVGGVFMAIPHPGVIPDIPLLTKVSQSSLSPLNPSILSCQINPIYNLYLYLKLLSFCF